jgi:hypothetical protein
VPGGRPFADAGAACSWKSIERGWLTPVQWLLQNHHTLDTVFAEDEQPWIEADADGMLAVPHERFTRA